MKILKLIILVGIFKSFGSFAQTAHSLKDSLLQIYSQEELSKMTLDEFHNVVRTIRKQPQISDPIQINGVVVSNDRQQYLIEEIEKGVVLIEENIKNYRQEIFPNTYRDIYDGFFDPFYKSQKTRELNDVDYKETIDPEEVEINLQSNSTRRTYFFDTNNNLKLVKIIYGYNINEGRKVDLAKYYPLYYYELSYYLISDSLLFYASKFGKQDIDFEFEDFSIEILNNTPVEGKITNAFFYKKNCFRQLIKSGRFRLENWEDQLDKLYFGPDEECNNFSYDIEEYYEYKKKQNNFLQPVKTSFLKPFTINPN